MEGDPRNPRVSLLKKYDIPIEHLSYEYVEKCSNKKELERIIRILRSGEEGSYPDLLEMAEKRLRVFAPDSRVLRVETPILTKECLTKEEWDAVENELLSWEEEMNIMDKSLDFEKGRFEVVGNKNVPDIRKVVHPKNKDQISTKTITENININNSFISNNNNNDNNGNDNNNNNNNNNNNSSKNKNNNCNSISNNSNNKRIKSGDYAAWDKFDVDKELLKIDVEEERKQEENEKLKRKAKKLEKEKKIEIANVDKENYSTMEQQVLANQAKDRGNECYKSGDFECALKYYEISIKFYPTANAYNNRAMTYLKLKQYEKAVKDCNKVLHLEKTNIKALHRRATAYQNMHSDKNGDEYNQLALQDLYKIVHLEPNNKLAQADLQKLKHKLNIQDTGNKFRMTISEELVNKEVFKQSEEKNLSNNVNENYVSTDKLPLTYYGPSTSTFQCQPYSMVHRALSGSTIPGQVLCKCNSSRSRQNPLCQRCGEAMCTPKPIKAVKSKNETKSGLKQDTNSKMQLLKQSSGKTVSVETNDFDNKITGKLEVGKNADECDTTKLNAGPEKIQENHLKLEIKSIANEFENKKNNDNTNKSNNVKELDKSISISNYVSKSEIDLTENNLTYTKVNSNNSEKNDTSCEIGMENTVETAVENVVTDQTKSLSNEMPNSINSNCNINNPTGIAEKNSSQGDVTHNMKKSKNKKKKLKDNKDSQALMKHLESLKMKPVKVVHAAKYLHPTSFEPKIKSEASPNVQREASLSSHVQYKAFVPNKKCYSTEDKRINPPATTPLPLVSKKTCSFQSEETNNDSSFEGNKENILKNNRDIKAGNGRKEDGTEEGKRDVVDSGFEFMKSWEELKKFDESYAKRAEIIRKIKPSDLSKVIGIKLDSDMLSCLVECLLRHFVDTDPKSAIELLKQLPQVPRFGLVSMFLGDSDKKKIKKLIETAENKGFKLDEDVKKNFAVIS